MAISSVKNFFHAQLYSPGNSRPLRKSLQAALILVCWFLSAAAVWAHTPGDELPVEISGAVNSTVFGMGHSIRITGTVTQGAMALGGDIIVEGIVEGDVATIGGSVIQAAGARIGGDVIIIGGTYEHLDAKPNRNPASMTMMYAGYEDGLRNLMRNPSELLKPHWSSGYFGLRVLAVLFWFVISLALTAVMPATISRGMARLQLTTIRVALIGMAGLLVTIVGVPLSLLVLPTPLGALVGLLALILIAVSFLFGRVIIFAATGRWLQRKYIPLARGSETVALLLGSVFWVLLLSLPYIWPVVVAGLMIVSFGLALTARYRIVTRDLGIRN